MFQNLSLPFLFNKQINLFKMKNKILIVPALSCLYFLSSCSGDRTPQNGKDTVQNTYHTKDTTKADTSKATSSDNSATGGAKALKDTAKKK